MHRIPFSLWFLGSRVLGEKSKRKSKSVCGVCVWVGDVRERERIRGKERKERIEKEREKVRDLEREINKRGMEYICGDG